MGFALLIMALGSFLVTFTGYMGLVGKLPPNPWAGIRTPFTMQSREAWYATHRAAGPPIIFGGVLVFAVSIAFAPFALAGKIPDPLSAGVVLGCTLVLLVTVLGAWLTGTRHARRELEKADQR